MRISLAAVISIKEAARPLLPPRIAGPARLRTAFLQRAGVAEAVRRLAEQQRPALGSDQVSTAHPSTLAVAAAAVDADLEDANEEEEGSTAAGTTAAWVAASPHWAEPGASNARFHFSEPRPPLSRSAPS